MPRAQFIILAAVVSFSWQVRAEDPAPAKLPTALPVARHIDPAGVDGSLVIAGGGKISETVWKAMRGLAPGDNPKLIVVTTASIRASEEEFADSVIETWTQRGFKQVEVLHAKSRDEADKESFCKTLQDAAAVWFHGGQQSRLAEAYVGTRFEDELKRLLKRGGLVGGTSAGAAIQSKLMIASGNPTPIIKKGLDLLPDSVIDQHFSQRNRKPRLQTTLKDYSGRFGLGIDEGCAVFVRGRRMRVLGESIVTVLLPGGAGREPTELTYRNGDLLDLTALRRAARDRQQSEFPASKLDAPRVNKGSLVIVGGGGMSADLVKRFIELAGGPDATIVVLPTASPDPLPSDRRFASMFTRAGAKNVKVLRQRALDDVNSAEFREAVESAGGVWFGGGRQWRFVDAYEGTQAHALFRKVLDRGGVIGGSSAGASIQAEYMVRGNPLGNTDMMALGYERGLGFLAGVAVDQHFTQRNRKPDLERVIRRFPQLLGIGLDEGTAIIVSGSQAEVAGRGDAYFLTSEGNDALAAERLPAGGEYDLAARKTTKKPQKNEEREEKTKSGG